MRIFILVPTFSPNIGGVESYLDDLCRYLVKKGHYLYVMAYQPITTKARGLSFEKRGNLEIRRISWFGHNLFHKLEPYPLLEFLYITPWLFANAFFFMLKHRKNIDVIHAHGLNAAVMAKFLAQIFKKKSVMSTCAVYNFKKGSLMAKGTAWALGGFDRVLSLANFSREELLRIGIAEDKVKPYYLWIDQEAYSPRNKADVKVSLGVQNKFLVLFVGRFIKIKGVEIILEVASRVTEDIHFCFIGDDGPLLSKVEEVAAQSKNVILIKGVRGKDLVPYYQAADLLVVPSLYNEAFGKVIIEALSCGTPVVGANKGAIRDIVLPAVGRVIEPTFENFQKEIEYFYHHRDELNDLTGRCRTYALEHFSEKNAEVIEGSYALS